LSVVVVVFVQSYHYMKNQKKRSGESQIFNQVDSFQFQTQSCNWRSSKAVPNPTRKRRNAFDGTTDDNDDDIEEEGEISSDPQALAMSAFNESLSDSINLFQAIHVLQSKEDELALKKNETSSGIFTVIS
jgi:hypothetical protein